MVEIAKRPADSSEELIATLSYESGIGSSTADRDMVDLRDNPSHCLTGVSQIGNIGGIQLAHEGEGATYYLRTSFGGAEFAANNLFIAAFAAQVLSDCLEHVIPFAFIDTLEQYEAGRTALLVIDAYADILDDEDLPHFVMHIEHYDDDTPEEVTDEDPEDATDPADTEEGTDEDPDNPTE